MKMNPDGKTVAAMDIIVPKIGEAFFSSRSFVRSFASIGDNIIVVVGIKGFEARSV